LGEVLNGEDTIVAIATPPGRGGIGVVRLSGQRAIEIATRLVRVPKLPPETQRATLGDFVDPETGQKLDQVILTCFRRPHSYTGEDIAEVSCHGAPVLLGYFVECCLAVGARAAEPGEFTLRAFLNGRIDLTQAEAVRDLVDAQTLYQARVAAQQHAGSLSTRLKPHKQVLLDLIARLEAGIDFAEDDVPVMDWQDISSRLDSVRRDLEKLVQGYAYGRIVREGLSLAIVGRPNVGKSSIFNGLLSEERAIVTPTPGTTRDLVAETASIGGIPLRLIDTAGIRHAEDEAETIGVEKAFQAIADSDLRLLVIDTSEQWTEQETELLDRLRPLGRLIIACNKIDLPSQVSRDEVEARLSAGAVTASGSVPVVWMSTLTGQGLTELRDQILAVAAPTRALGSEGEFITNLRHQQLLREAVAALATARRATEQQTPHEMLLLDLYDAVRALDAITGATYVDDVLHIIFSTFCVGK